jgi:luciferase family oxidoreductase group 1
VLLPYYSPLKVAESFRVLHALYPGRIDLGIGRAPGGGPLEAYALSRGREAHAPEDDFPERLVELLAFLHRGFPEEHTFAHIEVSPDTPGAPEVWLLGSSPWSANTAARLGLPYAFAHFINPEPTRAALEYYRSHVAGGPASARMILALGVICADTEAEAQRLGASVRLRRLLLRQGDRGPIPTPEEALAKLATIRDPEPADAGEWPRVVVGAPEQVHARLTDMADALHVDEVMVVTVVHDHRARLRSHELLAEAFGLIPRAAQRAD